MALFRLRSAFFMEQQEFLTGQISLGGSNLGRHSSALPTPGPMPQGMVVRLLGPKRSPASRQLGLVLQRLRRLLVKLFPVSR